MTFIEAMVLGIVQGATEFLPVSSSGHLVVFQSAFGLEGPVVAFDVALHLASLLAIVFYFRSELVRLFLSLFRKEDKAGKKLIVLLIIGTIPAVIFGVVLEDLIEASFSSNRSNAAQLFVTGIILWISIKSKVVPGKKMEKMKLPDALWIGIAQAISILPGISRSGSTIVTGLFLGIEKEEAARYSFLLSIPAITGAVVFKAKEVLSFQGIGAAEYAAGFLFSLIISYLSVSWMLKILNRGKLHYFAPYCMALGIAAYIFI